MASNPFGISAEASKYDKSVIEKKNAQGLIAQKPTTDTSKYKLNIIWSNVMLMVLLHTVSVYAMYLYFTRQMKFMTFVYFYMVASIEGISVTAGPHRLWSHRAYKAKWPLRFLLMLVQTAAAQTTIYDWVRDHRVHHKFTDTDADPHNAKRGFFFSHMGWLLVRKHPDVISKGATIDLSDLEKDPIVVWQRRYYYFMMPFLAFAPTLIPIFIFNESPLNACCGNILGYVMLLHYAWSVNSAAHMWGTKPYDSSIVPTENIYVSIATYGEGWHNYHHVFPWDYKTAEFGNIKTNFTTTLINFFARIGWAYDLKTVPAEIIKKRAARTGDGSIYQSSSEHRHSYGDAKLIWGLEDPDAEEFKKMVIVEKSE